MPSLPELAPFEEMLTSSPSLIDPRPRIAARDYSATDGIGFSIYALGAGAEVLAQTHVSAARRDTIVAELRRQGLRVGGTYGQGYVWVADEDGVTLWSRDAVVLEGDEARLRLASGEVSTLEVSGVIAFVSDDRIHRGVKLALKGGAEVIVADEHDVIAQLDPTYGHNELLASDVSWAVHLACDLARWLRVAFHDAVFGLASPDLAIVVATQRMADQLAGESEVTAFEPLDIPFVAEAHGALRLAPIPSRPGRYLELRVTTPSGESTTGKWLKYGSSGEIRAYLHAPETPQEIEKLIAELVESQARHDFP